MASRGSIDRFRFFIGQLRGKLWVRPLIGTLLSIVIVLLAGLADTTSLGESVPQIASDPLESLLSLIAASMLVIATFAVGTMVSAYSSAANTATPRSFTLVVADDTSQNALSMFIGAFIFSIVSLSAVKNEYLGSAGLFILFVLTGVVFALVVFTFVRWVDGIARLGRMGSTIAKVEAAATKALESRRSEPHLRGVPLTSEPEGAPVFASEVGYVQHIDVRALQSWAERADARIAVVALPGTFATPDRPLAFVTSRAGDTDADDADIVDAFRIGRERVFDEDPRFGLAVLGEIAGRALSPAVNDPGTAIDIVGTLVRILSRWTVEPDTDEDDQPRHDRIAVPALSVQDMFDDAFTAIARDGAGVVEVQVRLQKALRTLAGLGHPDVRAAAGRHADAALERAERGLELPSDLDVVRKVAASPR